jgi:hypothetical protein
MPLGHHPTAVPFFENADPADYRPSAGEGNDLAAVMAKADALLKEED